MLLGLNYKPERSLPALDHMDDTNALSAFRALRERTKRLVATLPSQHEYLRSLRTEARVAAVEVLLKVRSWKWPPARGPFPFGAR